MIKFRHTRLNVCTLRQHRLHVTLRRMFSSCMPATLTLVHAVNACEELWQDLLQQLQIGGQLLQRANHRVVLHDVLFSAFQIRSIRWSAPASSSAETSRDARYRIHITLPTAMRPKEHRTITSTLREFTFETNLLSLFDPEFWIRVFSRSRFESGPTRLVASLTCSLTHLQTLPDAWLL